jgi:phospholipase/carboxylesterase
MRFPQRVAGLMALSTYLPLQRYFADEVAGKISDDLRKLPIFMAHGTGDPVLPMALGERSRDLLQSNGFDIEWHEYPMAHAVCAREIEDIRNWLLATYAESD